MLMLKVAFRNLFRQKRRTILTGLSMLVGFVLGAFFIGWADGSYNYIIKQFTSSRTGQIQIHAPGYLDTPSIYEYLSDPAGMGEEVKTLPGVRSWAERLYSAGLVSVGEKSAAARIIGIQPEREEQTTGFSNKILEGRFFNDEPAMEAVIGKGLAEVLKAGVGDQLVAVSQGADGSIANDAYRIVGIAELGDDMSNRSGFYLHIEDARELLVLENRAHEIAINIRNLNQLEEVKLQIENRLSERNVEVATWKEFARSFYIAMKADKQGMWISLLIVILVVAVGVLNTVLMSVLERRREYGVLKALGTRPRQIVKMVFSEVTLLALVAIIIGTGIGLLLNGQVASKGIRLPQAFEYGGMSIEVMKSELNLRSFLIPVVTVLISAWVVSIFPSIKAARTDPARSMRMF